MTLRGLAGVKALEAGIEDAPTACFAAADVGTVNLPSFWLPRSLNRPWPIACSTRDRPAGDSDAFLRRPLVTVIQLAPSVPRSQTTRCPCELTNYLPTDVDLAPRPSSGLSSAPPKIYPRTAVCPAALSSEPIKSRFFDLVAPASLLCS